MILIFSSNEEEVVGIKQFVSHLKMLINSMLQLQRKYMNYYYIENNLQRIIITHLHAPQEIAASFNTKTVVVETPASLNDGVSFLR